MVKGHLKLISWLFGAISNTHLPDINTCMPRSCTCPNVLLKCKENTNSQMLLLMTIITEVPSHSNKHPLHQHCSQTRATKRIYLC